MDAQADLSLRWAHTHFVGFFMSWLKYLIIITISTNPLSWQSFHLILDTKHGALFVNDLVCWVITFYYVRNFQQWILLQKVMLPELHVLSSLIFVTENK